MASQAAGIDRWAAGIRYRMANDPGRQDLDDHILCNGFLFLDEYLEDILLGARTEPIIELTKTPGRRKDTSKKVRAATSATIKTVHLQLKSPDKENTPITESLAVIKKAPTSFQKALLKASKVNQPHEREEPPSGFPSPTHPEPDSRFLAPANDSRPAKEYVEEEQEEEAVEVLVTPPSVRIASGIPHEAHAFLPSPTNKYPVDTSGDPDLGPADVPQDVTHSGTELSIIAEGDENDMSRASLAASRPNAPIIRNKEISYHIPKDPSDPNGPMATVTVSYDPTADDDDDTHAFRMPYDRSFNDSEPTSTASSFPIDPYARDYETHELRQFMTELPSEQTEQVVSPHSPPAQPLVRKASVPVFPSLPGPSPLRKSTRELSVGGPLLTNARPSVATGNAGGTRTSWLNKARDVTAKRASVVNGVKRKSGDLTGEPGSFALTDGYGRATKVPKTSAEGGVSAALPEDKPQAKMPIQPFRAIVPVKTREQPYEQPVDEAGTPDGNSEGMMNILKRTVEGLGARVGKSMGKSLGGAAATAAAAEAKAAAEARLAQREAKGSDGNRQGRLSVSDLVGVYETSGTGKGKEPELLDPWINRPSPSAQDALSQSRVSISTTPPDSPPATRTSVPLPPTIGTAAHAIPKFTVQRQIPQEASFALPDSQQSTQSTYVSSVFDDHSAWPQSSLGTEYTASQGFSQPKSQDFAFTQDYATPELSKEVDWAQNRSNLAPTRNQTGSLTTEPEPDAVPPAGQALSEDEADQLPGAFRPEDQDMDFEDDVLNGADAESEEEASSDLAGKAGSSQLSSSTSAQTGFVAQASSLFSKVMGTSVSSTLSGSKRGKPEPVKSIQRAAIAAKKQQEEADKKAARLREMDKRRAAIASKKADLEAAEKAKQQGERRKREREEGPEKKVTRATVKVEEEVVKKRKVVVEIEKPTNKKSASKDKKDLGGSRIGKPALNVSLSQSQLGVSTKSFKQPGLPASASQATIKLVGSSQAEASSVTTVSRAGSSQIKDKGTVHALEDVRQPSQTLHAQMQARVEAQILQSRQEEPLIPSESIELPDINSEYSNSDDEDRPRTFDPPDWAQSPDLRLALQSQSRMNPDDIFGPVKPLHMEEIFTTKQSRFRARTSSANWAGTDELTAAEEVAYAKRMGYRER